MALRRRAFKLDTTEAQLDVGLSILFLGLATVAVVCRFLSRRIKRVRPAIDDWLIVAALIFYYGQGATNILMAIEAGVGHHKEDLSERDVSLIFKLLTVIQFPYGVTMTLIRCSICTLFIRIFFVKSFRYAAYAIMFLNIAWCLFVIIAAAALCTPFEYNWNKSLPNGKCGNQDAIYVAIAAWAIACDSLMWLLPIPFVWKLQIRREPKIALSAVFALGILDVAISVLRIIAIVQINFTADLSYTLVNTDIWSMAEPSIAIIVGCGPLFGPLFQKLSPVSLLAWTRKITSSSRTSKTDTYKHINDDRVELVSLKPRVNQGSVSVIAAHGANNLIRDVEADALHLPSKDGISARGKGINIQQEFLVRSDSK